MKAGPSLGAGDAREIEAIGWNASLAEDSRAGPSQVDMVYLESETETRQCLAGLGRPGSSDA